MHLTLNRFPVVDITHYPERTLKENLKAAQQTENEEVKSELLVDTNITLEKAIKFYKENSSGENGALFSATAKWLLILLDRSNPNG